jgi:hypothetical protein
LAKRPVAMTLPPRPSGQPTYTLLSAEGEGRRHALGAGKGAARRGPVIAGRIIDVGILVQPRGERQARLDETEQGLGHGPGRVDGVSERGGVNCDQIVPNSSAFLIIPAHSSA